MRIRFRIRIQGFDDPKTEESKYSSRNRKQFSYLKVSKCEIFDRSDFHDFYAIKSVWREGDFGVKIKI